MKKIKDSILYLFGAFIAFFSNITLAGGAYGPPPAEKSGFDLIVEKSGFDLVITPLWSFFALLVGLIVSIFIYFKRKRKQNVKKNS